jgi:hypothetical protein
MRSAGACLPRARDRLNSTTVRSMSRTNDLAFVRHIVGRLESAGVRTWVFGGWAAKLLGLSRPRPHHDVDLLYPAESFEAVDVFLATGLVDEIVPSDSRTSERSRPRASWSSCSSCKGPEDAPFTDFWGVSRYEWSSDVLGTQAGGLRVASAMSLTDYQAKRHDLLPSADGKQVSSTSCAGIGLSTIAAVWSSMTSDCGCGSPRRLPERCPEFTSTTSALAKAAWVRGCGCLLFVWLCLGSVLGRGGIGLPRWR